MKKIRLMIFVLTILIAGAWLGQDQVQAGAQITLQNNTSFTLLFYVDGVYQCRALGNGGFCTAQVDAGQHALRAYANDNSGRNIGTTIYIRDGSSPVWTVSEQ